MVYPSFYFLRHGETDANRQQRMCGGEWDIDLNETGREQSRKAADAVADIPALQGIYISPMLRARQTASFATIATGLQPAIVEDLREWCVGEWEAKPWAETANVLEWNHDPPSGESRVHFLQRIERGLETVLAGPPNRLIVSHGAVWIGLSRLLGFDAQHAGNAELIRAWQSASGKWEAEKLPSNREPSAASRSTAEARRVRMPDRP